MNLAANELSELPYELNTLNNLEKLNLSSNKFLSDYNAAKLWAHLASIPKLKELDISRNMLRGILLLFSFYKLIN